MRTPSQIAVVAVFVCLILTTDYALAPFANVKLEDVLVFVAAYAFGLGIGASVAVLAEVAWGVASPYGFGGVIIPFLVLGELVYALAGAGLARFQKGRVDNVSYRNIYFGLSLALCALLFDFETNSATAFIALGTKTTLLSVFAFQFVAIPFMLAHELSDFALGSLIAPPMIRYARKLVLQRPGLQLTAARRG